MGHISLRWVLAASSIPCLFVKAGRGGGGGSPPRVHAGIANSVAIQTVTLVSSKINHGGRSWWWAAEGRERMGSRGQYGIVSHTVACTSTFPVASAGAAGEAGWSAGERGDAAVPVACFLGVADADPPSPSAFRFASLGLKNDAIDAIIIGS